MALAKAKSPREVSSLLVSIPVANHETARRGAGRSQRFRGIRNGVIQRGQTPRIHTPECAMNPVAIAREEISCRRAL